MTRKAINKILIFLFVLVLILIIGAISLFVFPRSAYGPGYQDFSKSITNNYELFRTSSDNIIIVPSDGWNDEIATIPSKVLRLNDYEDFIVAERQGLIKESQNEIETPDENVIDYWILDTENNWVLKNLNFSEFQKKLDSLKIPRNIELIDVYEY